MCSRTRLYDAALFWQNADLIHAWHLSCPSPPHHVWVCHSWAAPYRALFFPQNKTEVKIGTDTQCSWNLRQIWADRGIKENGGVLIVIHWREITPRRHRAVSGYHWEPQPSLVVWSGLGAKFLLLLTLIGSCFLCLHLSGWDSPGNKKGVKYLCFIMSKICLSGYLRFHTASWVVKDIQERSGKRWLRIHQIGKEYRISQILKRLWETSEAPNPTGWMGDMMSDKSSALFSQSVACWRGEKKRTWPYALQSTALIYWSGKVLDCKRNRVETVV